MDILGGFYCYNFEESIFLDDQGFFKQFFSKHNKRLEKIVSWAFFQCFKKISRGEKSWLFMD